MILRTCTGAEIASVIPDLARLRVEIFKEFPYLYAGTDDYEREYLKVYAERDGAVVVVVVDGEEVVGASTGVPLRHEPASMRAPFQDAGLTVEEIFYGGESILRASHRGRGLYARLLAAREAHARRNGSTWLTFCAVERPSDHPARPDGWSPLDPVWGHFGYVPRPDLRTTMRWRDLGDAEETDHPMSFWLKAL